MLDIIRWVLMGILILFTCVLAPLLVRERIRDYPLFGKESLLWLSAGIILVLLPLSGLDWLHLLWLMPTAYLASAMIDTEVIGGPSFTFYYDKEDIFVWAVAGGWAVLAVLSLTMWILLAGQDGSSPSWFLSFPLFVFPAIPVVLFVRTIIFNARAAKCDLCGESLVLLTSDPEQTPDERLAIAVQAGLTRKVGHKCQDCGERFCQNCLENRNTRFCPSCGGMLDWA